MSAQMSLHQIQCLKAMVPAIAEEVIRYSEVPIELERDWQWQLVGSTDVFEIWNKSRQIGFSWGDALRSLIRAQLMPPSSYNKIFVSINRDEAREKIRYIKAFYDGMPKEHRKKLTLDNKLEIEFENGNSIRSFPSRAVRGVSNVDLSLDEFAHVREARAIYEGSTASTIRGLFGICIGSTPFGRGLFRDIAQGAGIDGEFVHYKYHEIPWWKSRALCKNPQLASWLALGYTTEERVYRFGTDRLIQEFESLPLEIFQQEYESKFIDTGNSVLSEELIKRNSDDELDCVVYPIDGDDKMRNPLEMVKEVLMTIRAKGYTSIFAGMDVGREVHASELILLAEEGGKLKTLLYLTMRRAEWDLQKDVIKLVMRELPTRHIAIDAQGIGHDIGEWAVKNYPGKATPIKFSQNTKEYMVSALLKAFESSGLVIYPDRRMRAQLLAVKKTFSTTDRILYQAASTKEEDGKGKSHADMFWALAMAVYAASEYMKQFVPVTRRSPILVARSSLSNSLMQVASEGGSRRAFTGRRRYRH